MDRDQMHHRDRVLRAYFAGRDWDEGVEAKLTREFVLASLELLPKYPLLIDHEWEVAPGRTQDGRGDLLFADGRKAFGVVEVKSITGSGSASDRRKDVERQAIKYAAVIEGRYPGSTVEALVYTDDTLYRGVRSAESRNRPPPRITRTPKLTWAMIMGEDEPG